MEVLRKGNKRFKIFQAQRGKMLRINMLQDSLDTYGSYAGIRNEGCRPELSFQCVARVCEGALGTVSS